MAKSLESVVFIEKAANFSLKLLIFKDFCKYNLLIIKCLTIEFYFLSSTKEFDYKRHDIEIFEKMMSFVSEEEFINSITDFRSSGRFFKWYEKCWDYVQYFQDYPQNRFINSYLNDSYIKLSKALDDLKSLTCQICRAYNTKYWEYEEPENEYTQEELREILMTQEYRKREIPYPDNNNSDEIRKYYDVIDNDEREIREVSDNVLRTNTIFRD